MQNTTERKDVYSRITAQIVEYLEKASARGYVRGMLNTPPAGLPVLCVTTASPTPESTSCPSGCPLSARTLPRRSG
jgi:hypothetical protein